MSIAIREMFASISGRYDVANAVLSFGAHRSWRRRVAEEAVLPAHAGVLDCATGTGDLALEFARNLGSRAKIVGVDFTPEMLRLAEEKAARRLAAVEFVQADVTDLPFANSMFDAASTAFGIRNVDNPIQGLREMARVVRPGGKVLVLEFGRCGGGLLGLLYAFYTAYLIPVIGGLLTGHRSAYRYLNRSSRSFPSGDAFLKLMQETGMFSRVERVPLALDVVYLYSGTVSQHETPSHRGEHQSSRRKDRGICARQPPNARLTSPPVPRRLAPRLHLGLKAWSAPESPTQSQRALVL